MIIMMMERTSFMIATIPVPFLVGNDIIDFHDERLTFWVEFCGILILV